MPTPLSITDQAITLFTERRWPMLPSTGPYKGPCVGWKIHQKRLPTVDKIRMWDRKFKPRRWGVVTGNLAGIVVVDFDGEAGREWMRQWNIQPHRRTGSGGFHYYVLHPGWRVPTLNAKTGKKTWRWPGVDVRGDGGFAIVFGRNANGSYEAIRDLVPAPFESLPEELRAFLRGHRKPKSPQNRVPDSHRIVWIPGERVDTELLIEKALALAAQDGRNNGGFWLACQLRDNGYAELEAVVVTQDYGRRVAPTNAKGQIEPYTNAEIAATVKQAYSKPARSPWGRREPLPQESAGATPTSQKGMATRDDRDSPSRKPNSPCPSNANEPDNLYLYVGHTGEPLVGHTGEPLSSGRFSRIPQEVTMDRRLRPRDRQVFAVLSSGCFSGGSCSIGKRWIARSAGVAERLVVDSLRRLEATGHVKKQPVGRGQRGQYLLLSPIFHPKQGVKQESAANGSISQIAGASTRKLATVSSILTGLRARDAQRRKAK